MKAPLSATCRGYIPALPLKAVVIHFNIAAGKSQVPLCGQKSLDKLGWAKGGYTRNEELVTCKKCARSLAGKRK